MATDKRTALSFDSRTVLKENELFIVCDAAGDIRALSREGQGLYFRDTRFLSMFELSIEDIQLYLLSSAGDQSFMGNLQFANNDGTLKDGTFVGARTISIRRNRFIRGCLHERIGFFNYNPFPVNLTVKLALGSDFRDMFEVRGYAQRARRGEISLPVAEGDTIWLEYRGLDQVQRRTLIRFDKPPDRIVVHAGEELADAPAQDADVRDVRSDVRVRPPHAVATFTVSLPPREATSITLNASAVVGDAVSAVPALDTEYSTIDRSYREWADRATSIVSDNELFNAVVDRALYDLRLLMDYLPSGLLPTAGIPWFSVPFGRDSLITSYQTLMLQPDIAYGTLRFLASSQGSAFDDWRDEEPGKILHEVRLGEMARLGEVPHEAYYGTVDATPLFVILLSELVRWTGDWGLVSELRPNLHRALEWIRKNGDRNQDRFLEYRSRSSRGVRNQGWKDSEGSVMWPDGALAEPPIAVVEAQGYAYDARVRAAELLSGLGDHQYAGELRAEAAQLKIDFERRFWLREEQFFGQALDASGKLVPAVTSNPGHCLWTGIISAGKAESVIRRLMSPDMLSGWGIRSMSSLDPNFNPMSYHNGSIWPHDNSLIMAGLKRYGFDYEANTVFREVYEAALRFADYRLPELYCGFDRDRRYRSMPAQYPVSCSPQAWAAGSIFLMIQQALGLRPDADRSTLYVRPLLPAWLNQLSLSRLRVGGASVDLTLYRERDRVRLYVRNSGGLKVIEETAPDGVDRMAMERG